MKRHPEPWLGPWLNTVRIKNNLQAKDIASKLNIHPANVARRECGDQAINGDDLPATLAAYGVTPKQFADKLAQVMR